MLGLGWLLIAAAPAAAARPNAPCLGAEPMRTCHVWTGTVVKVSDGDTIAVDVDRDGTGRPAKVRLTGIQAMELTRYGRLTRTGECHGVDATERLEGLVTESGGRVRLAALDPASTTIGPRNRLRRQVSVQKDGVWTDAGALLLQEGLALWFASEEEWAWNGRYSRLAEEAAARDVGIWDGRSCGTDQLGPAANAVRLKVKWNANGDDAEDLNGEWVRITKPTAPSAAPRRVVVPRLGAAPLHVPLGRGRGRRRIDSATDRPRHEPREHLFLGTQGPAFDNATNDRKQKGDGGYLFDPHGNLRAYVQYPCRTSCHEPLAGKVELETHYDAPEYVRVRNTSNRTISLFQYEIERAPWFYEFDRNSFLLPGQRLDLYVQRKQGSGTAFTRSWGQPESSLADEAGAVTLRNPLGAPVVCDAWGGEACPDV